VVGMVRLGFAGGGRGLGGERRSVRLVLGVEQVRLHSAGRGSTHSPMPVEEFSRSMSGRNIGSANMLSSSGWKRESRKLEVTGICSLPDALDASNKPPTKSLSFSAEPSAAFLRSPSSTVSHSDTMHVRTRTVSALRFAILSASVLGKLSLSDVCCSTPGCDAFARCLSVHDSCFCRITSSHQFQNEFLSLLFLRCYERRLTYA
jgi:hypothetical protein